MNILVSIYIYLAALFGVPTAQGQDALLDVGDRQTTSQSASKGASSGSSNRGLTRKGYIYNGF
jgi:hypothetical protein